MCVCFESDGHFLNYFDGNGHFLKIVRFWNCCFKIIFMSVYQGFRKKLRRSMSERVFFMYMPFRGEEGLNNFEVVIVLFLAVFLSPPS